VVNQDEVNRKAIQFSAGTIFLIVLLAAIVVGIWFFYSGSKNTKPPKETPRITGIVLPIMHPDEAIDCQGNARPARS